MSKYYVFKTDLGYCVGETESTVDTSYDNYIDAAVDATQRNTGISVQRYAYLKETIYDRLED